METRVIVSTQKPGKPVKHSILRQLPHDPKPIVGKPFARLGLVVNIRPFEDDIATVSAERAARWQRAWSTVPPSDRA